MKKGREMIRKQDINPTYVCSHFSSRTLGQNIGEIGGGRGTEKTDKTLEIEMNHVKKW